MALLLLPKSSSHPQAAYVAERHALHEVEAQIAAYAEAHEDERKEAEDRSRRRGITTINDKTVMVEYCVYWLENGEPMHEVFSSLAAAEMYSCAIRGKENIEWVEVSEEETIDLDELEDMFPDDFCGV